MSKKYLKDEQLKKVSGGGTYEGLRSGEIMCPKCDHIHKKADLKTKTVEDGCSEVTEFYCTSCDEWFR